MSTVLSALASAAAAVAAASLTPTRCLYFGLHLTLHLWLYILPRLAYRAGFLWPLSIAEYAFLVVVARWLPAVGIRPMAPAGIGRIFRRRVQREQEPRLLKVVAHPTSHATLRCFGLAPDNLYGRVVEASDADFYDLFMTPGRVTWRSCSYYSSSSCSSPTGGRVGGTSGGGYTDRHHHHHDGGDSNGWRNGSTANVASLTDETLTDFHSCRSNDSTPPPRKMRPAPREQANTAATNGDKNKKEGEEEVKYVSAAASSVGRNAFHPLLYQGPLYEGNMHTVLGALRAFDYLSFQRETVPSFDGNPICLDYIFPETEKWQHARESSAKAGKKKAAAAAATTATNGDLKKAAVASAGTTPPRKTASASTTAFSALWQRRRRRDIKALVLVLPGLTGTSREFYVQRMAKALYNNTSNQTTTTENRKGVKKKHNETNTDEFNNIQVVVLNARGVGDTPLDEPQIFSGLFTKDLRFVLENVLTRERIRDKFGLSRDVPVIGVSFSLGGLIMANYCGEEGLRAMRAAGLEPDDGNNFAANGRDASGRVTSNYGGGKQPMPLQEQEEQHSNHRQALRPSPSPSPSSSSSSRPQQPATTIVASRERNTPTVLAAAITVTSPHNLIDGDAAMNTAVTKAVYGGAFSRNLLGYYGKHEQVIQGLPGIRNRQALLFGSSPMPMERVAAESGGGGKGGRSNGSNTSAVTGKSKAGGSHAHPATTAARAKAGPAAVAATVATAGRPPATPPLIWSIKTVRAFDDAITAPHFGFENCFDYYRGADNFKKFPFTISTPFLSVVAANDPICGPPQPLRRYEQCAEQVESNKAILRCVAAVAAATTTTTTNTTTTATTEDHSNSSSSSNDDDGVRRGPPVTDAMKGGFVHVQFPVGGHLGFVSTPLDELLGRPNEMEVFVSRAVNSAIATWYAERSQARARNGGGGDEEDDDDDDDDDDNYDHHDDDDEDDSEWVESNSYSN